MLCLAFSMMLYGALVKTEVLGSTDGFNVIGLTLFGGLLALAAAGDGSLLIN